MYLYVYVWMFLCFNPAFGCQTSINLYVCNLSGWILALPWHRHDGQTGKVRVSTNFFNFDTKWCNEVIWVIQFLKKNGTRLAIWEGIGSQGFRSVCSWIDVERPNLKDSVESYIIQHIAKRRVEHNNFKKRRIILIRNQPNCSILRNMISWSCIAERSIA